MSDLRTEVAKALFRNAPARRQVTEPAGDWWSEVPPSVRSCYERDADVAIQAIQEYAPSTGEPSSSTPGR